MPRTIDDSVYWSFAAPRTTARTCGISKYSSSRFTAYISSFSVNACANLAGLPARYSRNSTGPLMARPLGRTVLASIGCIRRLAVHRAELSDGVEVLQGQSHRIDHAMALPARDVFAVLLQPRAHRPRRFTRALREVAFHAGRRRRRRRTDDPFQHPRAAQDGRGAIRIGGAHQNRAFAEQAHPVPVGERHPSELSSVDARHPVMARDAIVQIRPVRCQHSTIGRFSSRTLRINACASVTRSCRNGSLKFV